VAEADILIVGLQVKERPSQRDKSAYSERGRILSYILMLGEAGREVRP
jgi:hypothetical protein